MTKHEQLELLPADELVDKKVVLANQILTYNLEKTEMEKLKSSVDATNLEIKSLMKDLGLSEYIIDDIKASVTVTQKSDFVEDALLKKVKELGIADKVVKTREFVDMVALEDAIYQGSIHASQLADCQTAPKEIVTLRVTKIKAAK